MMEAQWRRRHYGLSISRTDLIWRMQVIAVEGPVWSSTVFGTIVPDDVDKLGDERWEHEHESMKPLKGFGKVNAILYCSRIPIEGRNPSVEQLRVKTRQPRVTRRSSQRNSGYASDPITPICTVNALC